MEHRPDVLVDEDDETVVFADYMISHVLPKPGSLSLDSEGMSFTASYGSFSDSVRWSEIESIDCDIARGTVRSLDLHLFSGRSLTVVPDDGIAVLRHAATRIGRNRIVSVNDVARDVPVGATDLLRRLRALRGKGRRKASRG